MKTKFLELKEYSFYTLRQAEELTGIPVDKLRGYITNRALQAGMVDGRVRIHGRDLINLNIKKK